MQDIYVELVWCFKQLKLKYTWLNRNLVFKILKQTSFIATYDGYGKYDIAIDPVFMISFGDPNDVVNYLMDIHIQKMPTELIVGSSSANMRETYFYGSNTTAIGNRFDVTIQKQFDLKPKEEKSRYFQEKENTYSCRKKNCLDFIQLFQKTFHIFSFLPLPKFRKIIYTFLDGFAIVHQKESHDFPKCLILPISEAVNQPFPITEICHAYKQSRGYLLYN